MPLSAPDRIAADRLTPRATALWRALQPLKTVVGFLNSGAHPDDETSTMLAVLAFRDGINLSYVCANRGEGGQNDIGTEMTEDLGTVRTAEMERAADVLDMRLYWLSETPEDRIFDFGFSKSGVETMAKWGRDRTLARLVDVVRIERPDILCPTFLNIPGQHGHHRAMTEAAHLVMDLAADTGFAGSRLPAWQVSKLYLPAWSGAGGAYDDEVPPPPATVIVPGTGTEEISGWPWARIGQQSRWFHKTQGMGHWVAPGTEKDYPLYLADSRVGPDSSSITDNLPLRLADLNAALAPVDAQIDTAIGAFPNRAAVMAAALAAYQALASAHAKSDPRQTRKLAQLARVIRLASGAEVRGWLADDVLEPGQGTTTVLESRAPDDAAMVVSWLLPKGWKQREDRVHVATDAAPSDPYPPVHDPLHPAAPALAVEVAGAQGVIALEQSPLVLPRVRAALTPDAAVVNLSSSRAAITVMTSGLTAGTPAFDLPQGWTQFWEGGSAILTPPDDLAPGLITLPLTLDGHPAQTVRRFHYPHIAPRLRSFPATLRLRALHVTLPDARIGYIGGGNDRVAHWLRAIGCDVTEMDAAALASPAPFAPFDTVLIGVFAIRTRPDLRARLADLHAWVKAGGTLSTLYHRPWDMWDPGAVPPARLEIGQPSLRWRVTDENAVVTHLAPAHPILNGPNPIGPDDWAGWHKERGLYFAKSWDPAYTALLEMADPDEAPHQGALLSADIGAGRHTHCALILHHQMEKLTPGAFRLMANMLTPR